MPEVPEKAALNFISGYDAPDFTEKIKITLDASGLRPAFGSQVLVKPNLLQAVPLACTHPKVIAAVCEWLKDAGCKLSISDSPGFGSVTSVARKIGLTDTIRYLKIPIVPMNRPEHVNLMLENGQKAVHVKISSRARECDFIFSVCKVKAHRQMRISLAVKNCFGCIPGARKALMHAIYGKSTEFFADFITAMFQYLPPVVGFADGIEAMSGTGPVKGQPCRLNLVGAAKSAITLDGAILQALKIPEETAPISMALKKRGLNCSPSQISYPLQQPKDFNENDFSVPADLVSASFNPWFLTKSVIRRFWQSHFS